MNIKEYFFKHNKYNVNTDNILETTNDEVKQIMLFELASELKERKIDINIKTFENINIENLRELKDEITDIVKLLDNNNKYKHYIQELINSNIIILNYNFNKDNYKKFKKNLLYKNSIDFYEDTDGIQIEDIEKKIEFINLAINYRANLNEQQRNNLKNIIKNMETVELRNFIKSLDKEKTSQKKESFIRKELEKINKIVINKETNKEQHLYNQEYYDLINNPRISNQKVGIIKYAYFKNGIDLKDFAKDLEDDLFKCDAEQLKNYVDAYTRYKDDFLSKNEYEFAKKVIKDYDINQKEIGETILPTIEKSKLSQKQIQNCIYAGKNRDYGDTTKIIKLADTAKKFGFVDNEINRIIEYSKTEKTVKIQQEIDLIKEYGYSKITKPEAMKKLDIKEMEILLKDKNKGKFLNNNNEIEI